MPNVITANVAASESTETPFWDRVNGTFRQKPRATGGFKKVLYYLPACLHAY